MRTVHRWLLTGFLFGFLGAVGVSCGGGTKTCNASTCATGCCDAMGTCQPSGSNTYCGSGGALCVSCPLGQFCSLGLCVGNSTGGGAAGGGQGGGAAGGGTGGGATGGGVGGGGGGTGGGTGGGCTTITTFPTLAPEGYYDNNANYEITGGSVTSATTDPYDIVGVEVIWAISGTPTNVMVPSSVNLATGGTYRSCLYCTTLSTGCSNSTMTCAQRFLGRAGTMVVSQASRTMTGSISATLTDVRFEEWNLSSDTPVTGGQCYLVQSATVNATF
ncbi:MAG: hypothetical protein IT380_24290 [Myxococcales bacterium]|nr:hypothetical protein [Myxococcales bacterium]